MGRFALISRETSHDARFTKRIGFIDMHDNHVQRRCTARQALDVCGVWMCMTFQLAQFPQNDRVTNLPH